MKQVTEAISFSFSRTRIIWSRVSYRRGQGGHLSRRWIIEFPSTLSVYLTLLWLYLYVCLLSVYVQADQSGTIVEILAEDGKPVSMESVRAITFPFYILSDTLLILLLRRRCFFRQLSLEAELLLLFLRQSFILFWFFWTMCSLFL